MVVGILRISHFGCKNHFATQAVQRFAKYLLVSAVAIVWRAVEIIDPRVKCRTDAFADHGFTMHRGKSQPDRQLACAEAGTAESTTIHQCTDMNVEGRDSISAFLSMNMRY